MVKGALLVGWGPLLPGREKAGAKVLGDAMHYLQRQKEEGRIEAFDVVMLEPHGGELAGFVLLRGDKEKIATLRVDDEFVETIVGVQLVHSNVGVVGAYTGAELPRLIEMWDRQEGKLLRAWA